MARRGVGKSVRGRRHAQARPRGRRLRTSSGGPPDGLRSPPRPRVPGAAFVVAQARAGPSLRGGGRELGATGPGAPIAREGSLALQDEVAAVDQELERLAHTACPALLAIFDIGPDTRGCAPARGRRQPGVCARRRRSPGFAAWLQWRRRRARSSDTGLNRGGDRHANAALHRIVMVRLRWCHQPTTDYVARRTTEG